MERLDVGVLVWCFGWNSLMLDTEFITPILKYLADELWTVICTYNKNEISPEYLTAPQGPEKCSFCIFAGTGKTEVIINYFPVKYVYDTHEKAEPIFSRNVNIFNVDFPKLIRTVNYAVLSYSSWVFSLYSSLRLQNIKLFTQSISLFLVYN